MPALTKTVLIMAGGHGERFWPSSRTAKPKQFLALTDDERTMIQLTVDRIRPYTAIENVFVVTSESYREILSEQIPDLPEENILCEPAGRNTAPCIALGAVHMAEKYGAAVMTVLPSDHLVQYPDIFRDVLQEACEVAEAGENLVTIGIPPDEPETGYGYIKFIPRRTLGKAYPVERFVEKPDLETAKMYVESRAYLWNSGMFTWKVSTILNSMTQFLPQMTDGLQAIRRSIGTPDYSTVLRECFVHFPSISIDYGVMEKAENIFTLTGTFGWDDVGSWLAVSRIRRTDEKGNVSTGNVIAIDTRNTIIQAGDKLIAAVGLENLVVVDTEDALLLCNKERAGEIRQVIQTLKNRNMTAYL